jgi:TolB protein
VTFRYAGLVLLTLAAGTTAAASTSGDVASVAFVSIRTGDPQIFTRDATGRLTMVTSGKDLPAQPAWSPNGRLAYVARVGNSTRVFITDVDGQSPTRLTTDDRNESSPSFSRDGRSIAYFSSAPGGGDSELRVVQLSKRVTSVIARSARDMGPGAPSWSGDGKWLAYSVNFDRERSHIWLAGTRGGEPRNVSEQASSRGGAWPDLAPDGRHLLWVADKKERLPIMVTDVATGESRELTPQPDALFESARWSPDGRAIVAARAMPDATQTLSTDIVVMSADGTQVRNLTQHPGDDFDPRWSADGRAVVYASLRSGTSLLYETRLDDGSTRVVSEHPSHDMDHVVRPTFASK